MLSLLYQSSHGNNSTFCIEKCDKIWIVNLFLLLITVNNFTHQPYCTQNLTDAGTDTLFSDELIFLYRPIKEPMPIYFYRFLFVLLNLCYCVVPYNIEYHAYHSFMLSLEKWLYRSQYLIVNDFAPIHL